MSPETGPSHACQTRMPQAMRLRLPVKEVSGCIYGARKEEAANEITSRVVQLIFSLAPCTGLPRGQRTRAS